MNDLTHFFESPYTINTTSLDDKYTNHVVYRPATTWASSTTLSTNAWYTYDPYSRDLVDKIDLYSRDLVDKTDPLIKEVHTVGVDNDDECKIICEDPIQLSQENILKYLPAFKGKLMLQVAPIQVKRIECDMTPAVKNNIVRAYKKLQMYGKTPPIIPRFDEYGNRLSDKINIDAIEGTEIHIIDPEEYGEYYFSLKAIKLKPLVDIDGEPLF